MAGLKWWEQPKRKSSAIARGKKMTIRRFSKGSYPIDLNNRANPKQDRPPPQYFGSISVNVLISKLQLKTIGRCHMHFSIGIPRFLYFVSSAFYLLI